MVWTHSKLGEPSQSSTITHTSSRTIKNLTKVSCTSRPNLAILAQMGHKLSHRQAQGWPTDAGTHGHSHRQAQATTIPEDPNWPRVKHDDVIKINGNMFHVTGHLGGEFTGHRWIPRTKASNAELWCFSLICAWMNDWVNNREAGDLRSHRTHYDVT